MLNELKEKYEGRKIRILSNIICDPDLWGKTGIIVEVIYSKWISEYLFRVVLDDNGTQSKNKCLYSGDFELIEEDIPHDRKHSV